MNDMRQLEGVAELKFHQSPHEATIAADCFQYGIASLATANCNINH